VDPVPDPLLRKSGSAGNRTQTFGSVPRNSDHQTTEAVTRAILTFDNEIYVLNQETPDTRGRANVLFFETIARIPVSLTSQKDGKL
jgi:hypothetical protein